jgi:exodeoxyribonuclease VII small subunit
VTRKKADTGPAPAELPSFEEALSELEELVDSLEQGDLSLEESLKSFERGVALARACQEALTRAEQKVAMLSSTEPDAEPTPFESD